MKKFVFLVAGFFVALVLFAFTTAVQADPYGLRQTLDEVNNRNGELIPETVAGKSTVPEVIGQIVSVALGLIGIIFFGLTLYAGFRWMTAMGNTEHVEKAKSTLETAAIGLAIVLAAYAITRLVFENLTGVQNSASVRETANKTVCCTYKDGSKKTTIFKSCNEGPNAGESMVEGACPK